MNQDTTQATEIEQCSVVAQVPDYKTRTIQADERDLILLVLDESIRIGTNYEFDFNGINNINHLALQRTSHLSNIIEHKKVVFLQLDQRSYVYTRILQVAKLALHSLQNDGEYNIYSADLIYKFIQLETVFAEKHLKSSKLNWIETSQPSGRPLGKPADEQPIVLDINEDDIVYIPEGATGKHMKQHKRKLEEQAELGEQLKSIDFSEETPATTDLQSMDFTD